MLNLHRIILYDIFFLLLFIPLEVLDILYVLHRLPRDLLSVSPNRSFGGVVLAHHCIGAIQGTRVQQQGYVGSLLLVKCSSLVQCQFLQI